MFLSDEAVKTAFAFDCCTFHLHKRAFLVFFSSSIGSQKLKEQ